MAGLSPLMEQYLSIKEQNQDTILFFRVGDFYEMFFDDAHIASKELELTLTGKDCGLKDRAPMCGVPYHSAEQYIARLVAKGYKVGICEQTEDPAKAKGLVRREVIRVVTPGTVMESSMLDESSNNFICSVFSDEAAAGIAFCDISTGELFATRLTDENQEAAIKDEITKFYPKEIVINTRVLDFTGLSVFLKDKLSAFVNVMEDEYYEPLSAERTVLEHFRAEHLKALGLDAIPQTVGALCGMLVYLKNTQITGLERIAQIEIYQEDQYVHIDYNTRRNLELTEPLNSKNKSACLFAVLNKTETSMGKRLLKSYIEKPLVNVAGIIKRQNGVTELYDNVMMRSELKDALKGIGDMQRMITRIIYGNANARELKAMSASIQNLPAVRQSIANAHSGILKTMYSRIETMDDIVELVEKSIVDDPPFSVREGGIIREGFDTVLDELRFDMNHTSEVMAKVEAREREATGISKLKIGYNRVFGYYIEVPNSYKNQVPDSYIRKQTLTSGERYITQELKDLEQRLLKAKDSSCGLEYDIFNSVRKRVAEKLNSISRTANAVAVLDVLASLAQTAFDNNYACPVILDNGTIKLKNSRHPVVEQLVANKQFVPNDVYLDTADNRVAIITGPNMAGKSTYMRQVALISLMAQIGSYVPADSAEISVVDSIFTRIGASDDLSSGQSTFMVEMNEVAYILENATPRSLLILDEIGRGTSTFDGMSIARAVLEYVADKKHLGAKTLFATHYHELTVLENTVKGVKNYNIAAIKRGDSVTFLRRIIPGPADESYGVEVAALAGLPESVIARAKKILAELERDNPKPKRSKKKQQEDVEQFTLQREETLVEKRLNSIDINKLTPMDSMNILFELIKLAKQES